MQYHDRRLPGFSRWQSFYGALLAAVAVALSAYAAHAAEGAAQSRLHTAALFAFGHGVAFVGLAPLVQGRWRLGAAIALQLGVLLFSGSLIANVLLGWPTTLAPTGGLLLIAGWLAWAFAALRSH